MHNVALRYIKSVTSTGRAYLRETGGGEGVDEESNHMTARKPGPLYKSFNLLSAPGVLYRVLVNPLMQKKMFEKNQDFPPCLDVAFLPV